MKGIRFYQERTPGSVYAAFVCNGTYAGRDGKPMVDGMGSVYAHANSPVAGTGASRDYLRDHCRRVGEAKARKIHPALFAVLDRPDLTEAQP